jgi:hypothetical protein
MFVITGYGDGRKYARAKKRDHEKSTTKKNRPGKAFTTT